MKERMCMQQGTILETGFNIHVSRCENPACKFYLGPIHKEICEGCSHRIPITGKDELADLLADVELGEQRQDEIVEHLFDDFCKKCAHYENGICNKMECECSISIRDLMRNPNTHCPLELW